MLQFFEICYIILKLQKRKLSTCCIILKLQKRKCPTFTNTILFYSKIIKHVKVNETKL